MRRRPTCRSPRIIEVVTLAEPPKVPPFEVVLALVGCLVEEHGAEMTEYMVGNGGGTISLRVPIARGPSHPPAPEPEDVPA